MATVTIELEDFEASRLRRILNKAYPVSDAALEVFETDHRHIKSIAEAVSLELAKQGVQDIDTTTEQPSLKGRIRGSISDDVQVTSYTAIE